MMHDKAMRRFGAVISSLVCGALVACAGGDTPQVSDDLESAISENFGSGAGAVAGGAGGRAPTASAGSAGAPGSSGAGGQSPAPAPVAAGGSAGAAPTTETPSPSTGDVCDGFGVLFTNCSGGSCHSAGGIGDFAESEEAAAAFVGVSGSLTCAGEGPLLVPENPRQSIIVQKVNGTASCGQPMPIAAPPLTDDEISCLEEWIATL